MKKLISILLLLLICIGLFGCDASNNMSDTQVTENTQVNETDVNSESETNEETMELGVVKVFGRVEHFEDNAVIVRLDDIGNVYIEVSNGTFKLFETVAVTYREEELIEKRVTNPCTCWGSDREFEHDYEYALLEVIELRKTDPSKGEPLYD